MSVVEQGCIQGKTIKNVARKSTTKPPQSWNLVSNSLKRDITPYSNSKMESTGSSEVYQETLDNLKALNGETVTETPVRENGHISETDLKVVSSESVQDNGLLDKNPAEDGLHVSTDEEDNLLNLSDSESQENKEVQRVENNDSDSKESHPLAIGVQVRNSVRDIMSKLVKECSPEVNKILSKPKNEDLFKENSPKMVKSDNDYKSEGKNSPRTIKENLFEIMSAESESDDIFDGNSSRSHMVSEDMGEDTNNSLVSMETTTQSEINTQDNTVSSLSIFRPSSVSTNSADANQAETSNKLLDFDNSVSAPNSSSMDYLDKVSDISDSAENSNSAGVGDSQSFSTENSNNAKFDSQSFLADNFNSARLDDSQSFLTENSNSARLDDSQSFLTENSNSARLDDSLNVSTENSNSAGLSEFQNVSDLIDVNSSGMKDDCLASSENIDKSDKIARFDLHQIDDMDGIETDDISDKIENSDKIHYPENKSGSPKFDEITDINNMEGIETDKVVDNSNDNLDKGNLDITKNENQNDSGIQINRYDQNKSDIDKVYDEKDIKAPKADDIQNSSEQFDVLNKTDSQDNITSLNVTINSASEGDQNNGSKPSSLSDDDILDLNENSVSPKPMNDSDNMGDDYDNRSDKLLNKLSEKGKSESPSMFKPSSSMDSFQFSVDDDDNSNSNMIGKIDIDKICDNLLFDEPKPDVSVDKGAGMKPKEKENSDKDADSSMINGDAHTATENGDKNLENEDTEENKKTINPESKDDLPPKSESMEIDNTTDGVKDNVKDDDIEMKCEEKVDSTVTDKNEIKNDIDKKSDINIDTKADTSDVKDEKDEKPVKTDSMEVDAKSLETSKSETTTTDLVKSESEKSEVKSELKPETIKERKRSGESPTSESQAPPKRSRLDIMIGKLGSQIGIAPESVPDPIDCDTVSDSEEDSKEESDEQKSEDEDAKSATEDDEVKTIYEEVKKPEIKKTEEKEVVSEKVTESKKEVIVEEEKQNKIAESEVDYSATTISDDDEDDDVRVIGEEPKKAPDSTPPVEDKEISYDKDLDLNDSIKKHVLKLIKSYRDETIAALEQKLNYLTKSCEQWKDTARNLQKQVVDLTIVQQRLDKRKAATAALKVITSRTIGCQVDTTRLQGGSDVKSPPKMAPGPFTSYTVQIPNNVPVKNMVSMIKQPQRQTTTVTSPVVNNMSQLLSATAESRNTNINSNNRIAPSSVRNLLETTGRSSITQNTVNTATVSGAKTNTKPYPGKVIDLTADEEITKKLNNSQVKAPIIPIPVSNLPPVGTTQILRPVTPGSLPPGSSILLSGPSGTQIVNQSQFNRMGGALQVVTVSAGSQIRPGQFLTVVPQTGGNLRPQLINMTSPIPSATASTTPIVSKPIAQTTTLTAAIPTKSVVPQAKHPAPLPAQPVNKTPNGGVKGLVPPKPDLKISRVTQGIVLSWTITQNLSLYSEIASYQLFAYQEGTTPPNSNLWKKVGDVKALPLPMACTLTQFQEGNKYHFAVRAIDVYQRISEFSEPSSIHLFPKT